MIRLALLGGATNSAVGRAHVSALRLDRRFTLVAGCLSRDMNSNLASGSEYGIDAKRLHDSLDSLLREESDNIDMLVVLTPTDQHAQQVRAALNAGVAVVCEKSLATTGEEALEIEQSCATRQGFLAVVYNYTGYPMVREARARIRDGQLGPLKHIRVEMPQEGYLRRGRDGLPIRPQAWRLRDGAVSTVSLDLGVHTHNLAWFLTGETPQDVLGVRGSSGLHPGVIDDVDAVCQYSGGLKVAHWYGKTALGYRNGLRFRVFGRDGSLEWYQERPDQLCQADAFGRRWIVDRGSPDLLEAGGDRYCRFKAGHPTGFVEALANYYVDIADTYTIDPSSRKDTPFVFGASHAHDGLRFLEAIEESAMQRRWINLQ